MTDGLDIQEEFEEARDESVDSAFTAHVAKRLKQRRREIGARQHELAAAIGVSIQQISKYELGDTRFSAAVIWRLARSLSVEGTYFYENSQSPTEIQNSDDYDLPFRPTGELDKFINEYLSEQLRNVLPVVRGSKVPNSPVTRLANAAGIGLKQIYKYRDGANAMSAFTLLRIAKGLGLSVSYFYLGLEDYLFSKRDQIPLKEPAPSGEFREKPIKRRGRPRKIAAG